MLTRYSGLIASSFAIFFIALPALLAKYDKSRYPISWIVTFPKWKFFFNVGAIVSGIFQFIFIFYLTSKYLVNPKMGTIIYSLGAISCFFLGIFHINSNKKIHNLFAIGFFLLNSIGGFIFSLTIVNTNVGQITTIFAFLELLSLLIFLRILKRTSLAELLAIIFSALWAISFYLVK